MSELKIKCQVQVHILPSNKKATSIGRYIDSGDLVYNYPDNRDIPRGVPQDIYFTSDEEIKEGDWVLVPHNVEGKILSDGLILFQAGHNFMTNHYIKSLRGWYKKVVATTDKSLNLPLIPESFIQKYVEEQGGIKEVNLDCTYVYEAYPETGMSRTAVKEFGHGEPIRELLLNVDLEDEKLVREVIVSKVKDTFTKEELEKYSEMAFIQGTLYHKELDKDLFITFKNWFNQQNF